MAARLPFTELVLATHNAGKLAEMRDLLAPYGVAVRSAGEFALPVPDETEETFEGNAAIKAEAARDATGMAALADDSGLEVAALGGAPGVRTADWGGPERDFSHAMDRVLGAIGDGERTAAFVSVLALARPGEPTLTFEGRCEGTIAREKRGTSGHGYDPIFIPADGDGRTFGEMTQDEKNRAAAPLSHRARAMAAFLAALAPDASAQRA